jgi:hypothetical protein
MQRYGQIISSGGKVRRKYMKTATSAGMGSTDLFYWFINLTRILHVKDGHPHFLHYAAELAGALRHAVLVDQVCHES